MTIKLNFIFIAMDLFTLLAYPIVFVHGRIRRFFKLQEMMSSVEKPMSVSAVQALETL